MSYHLGLATVGCNTDLEKEEGLGLVALVLVVVEPVAAVLVEAAEVSACGCSMHIR